MSQQQPRRKPNPAEADSSESPIFIGDSPEDTPAEPLPPHVREAIRRQVVDSYAVDREKIAKVKQAAILLGCHKADLICEGLDLVLEKYRDKLDELLASQPPGDRATPENGPPSA